MYMGPVIMTLTDYFFNRIYLNITSVIWYPIVVYLSTALYLAIISTEITAKRIPEFQIFTLNSELLTYSLPAIIALSLYIITRIKFLLLSEGDLSKGIIKANQPKVVKFKADIENKEDYSFQAGDKSYSESDW